MTYIEAAHMFHRQIVADKNGHPRGLHGHFRPLPDLSLLRDEQGRRLVPMDLMEVERRLKAREIYGEAA